MKLITVANTVGTQITVSRNCSSVTIGEDASVAGWPTTDYYVYKSLHPADDLAAAVDLTTLTGKIRRIPAGQTYTFGSRFGHPGNINAGAKQWWIQAVSGSTTFFQDEGGES